MISVVEALVDFLIANVGDLDADLLRANAGSYVGQLEELDAEIDDLFEEIPPSKRVLLTNHQVFNYFAEQYGFRVVGTLIPSSSTLDSANAKDLAGLVQVIKSEGVTAIFADVSAPDVLAETLAAEVGDIQIVDLYSESLGTADSDAASYLGMVRTNSRLIAGALAHHDDHDDHDVHDDHDDHDDH